MFQDVLIFFKPNVRGHLQIRVSLGRLRIDDGYSRFSRFLRVISKKLKTMSIFVSNEHGTTSLEIGQLAAQFAAKLHIARGCFLRQNSSFFTCVIVQPDES